MPRKLEPAVATLAEALEERTGEGALGALYEKLDGGAVRCVACGHRCRIPDGHDGICRIRFNRSGMLRVPRGYVAGLQVDPIEKKPFFHALPGGSALSFGMLGCDYHCAYCQNWLTSQTLRDHEALARPRDVTAEEVVALARKSGAPAIVSTYNEPLITSEWAVEVFSLARREGIVCGYVSNGNATPEVLEYLRPHVDLFKVDLKSFREGSYQALGGRLDTVLDTIRGLHAAGFWVEVVTLVVPGWNDSADELTDLASFLSSVSPDLPWHVTAFHGDYRMTGTRDTAAADLMRAAAIGTAAGLRFVYAGNLPGAVGDLEHTRCPRCSELLIERRGYRVRVRNLAGNGACGSCGTLVPGFWRAGVHVPAASAPRAGEATPGADPDG